MSEENRERDPAGLGSHIEPGSADDWTPEQLDRLSADPTARGVLQPDGAFSLTREDAVRVVAALLFYLRGWEEGPVPDAPSAPTAQLIEDGGSVASEVLDGDLFPAEVLSDASDVWEERWSNRS